MNVVKSEKKPRRNIQYKDMGNATGSKTLFHANFLSKQPLSLESTACNF